MKKVSKTVQTFVIFAIFMLKSSNLVYFEHIFSLFGDKWGGGYFWLANIGG